MGFELDVYKICLITAKYIKFVGEPIRSDYFLRLDLIRYASEGELNDATGKNSNHIDRWLKIKTNQENEANRPKMSYIYLLYIYIRIISLVYLLIVFIVHAFIIKSDMERYAWLDIYLTNPYGSFKNTHMYNIINFSLIIIHIMIFCQNQWEKIKREDPKHEDYDGISLKRIELAYISCLRISTSSDYRCLFKLAYASLIDRLNNYYPFRKTSNDLLGNEDCALRFATNKVNRLHEEESLSNLVFKYNLINFQDEYEYYAKKLIETGSEKSEIVWKCRWISPKKYHTIYTKDFYLPSPVHRMDIIHLCIFTICALVAITWEISIWSFFQAVANILELHTVAQTKIQFRDTSYYNLRMIFEMWKPPHITRLCGVFAVHFNHLTHHIEAMLSLWSALVFHSRLSKTVNSLLGNCEAIDRIDSELDKLTRRPKFNRIVVSEIEIIKQALAKSVRNNIRVIDILQYEFRDIKRNHSNLLNILIITNMFVIPYSVTIIIRNDYYFKIEILLPLVILCSCIMPFSSVAVTAASIDNWVSCANGTF